MRTWIAILLVLTFATAGAQPAHASAHASASGTILFNEVANGGSRSNSDSFFELRNWGARAVDLTGWSVYRCSEQGLRSNLGRTEGELTGVVLEPGEIFTVSKVGLPGEAHITQPLSPLGFGLFLATPSGARADSVAVYPNEPWPTESECGVGGNLTNTLATAFDESWQRVAATGVAASDFVVATSTLTKPNVRTSEPGADTTVVIDEFTASGPAATDDEFVELRNTGEATIDVGGWQLYACDTTGRLGADALTTIARGSVLAPGDSWVLAARGFTGRADSFYTGELDDVQSGVLIRTDAGQLVDRVAVSAYEDSACQGENKLAASVDYVAAESYQRAADGWILAPRTPGTANRTQPYGVASLELSYGKRGVAISEIATDPALSQLPAGSEQRNFIEIANYGDESVDIGGWTLRRCEASGIRSRELQTEVPTATTLEPGETWLAARSGTPLASASDATYAHALNMLGAGVWLADARGTRVDSAGIYAANEMDAPNVVESPCTKGVALTTYQPDRLLAQTFQRSRFTGVDADDFVTAEATPGVIDEHPWIDPTQRVAGSVTIEKRAVDVAAAAPAGERVTVLASYSGVSDGPLTTLSGADETRTTRAATSSGWDHPYQRFVLDASSLDTGATLNWSGSSTGRNEVQFSVWSGNAWRLLDAGSASAGQQIALSGVLERGDIQRGRVTILAQDGPRTEATLGADEDGALQHPDDYDFAVSHITDTQYLSESYPEVYAQLVSWIADNEEPRKIAFATHTGDLIQNWVDPAQNDERARREFETASAVQGILDDAGVPNSVLPGNHDNKRGAAGNDLFNEYFGPERYADSPSYAGSIAPGDNSANFSTFERAGAKFLMLSLPYAYSEREIAWAESVVTSHADYNVIVSTHEHVTPKTEIEDAHRSVNSRWLSQGQQLWDRVIAPNRNVGIVLSGHFHGIGQIRTENAGGIEGHDVVELLADYQEFRTHTGERATGFQRLLQFDLASSSVAVDTFSVRLDATASFDYDYPQFVPDTGLAESHSNVRPWNLVDAGVQGRYTAADDDFTATVSFQYDKRVATRVITTDPPALADPLHEAMSLSRFGLTLS